MEENTQDGDYNDFNDLDYEAAKQLLTQGSSMPTQVENRPNYEVPDMNYDDALKLLRSDKGGNVTRGTSNIASKDEDDGMHLNSFGKHLLAEAGSAAQNTVKNMNMPRLDQYFKGIPTVPGGNTNLYDKFGIQKGGLDEFGENVMGFLPYASGAGAIREGAKLLPGMAKFIEKNPYYTASAAENALSGGAYGAVQDGESGAETGAIAGALSPFPAAATDAALRYGAQKFAQSAIPGMTKRATDYMRNLLSPNDYTTHLKGNFKDAFDKNTANWGKVDEAAAALDNSFKGSGGAPGSLIKSGDKTPQTSFDNTPYLNHIDDYINKINDLEPARREEYSQALDFANKARELAPESVQGAVAAHKNLNQALKEFMGNKGVPAANMRAKEFVSGLKDNLKENMSNDFLDSRMKDLGYNQSFSDIWNDANKSHADLQNFYKVPDKFGSPEEKKNFKSAIRDRSASDEGALIGQYAPKPAQTGTEGLDQLANVMGSKSAAQDAVKSYINRRPLTNGVSTLDVSNEYAKLSPAQRDWIYGGSKEGDLLNTINNVRQSFGKEPARSLLTAGTHHALGLGLPFLAGSAGAHYLGGDWKDDLLAGLGVAASGKIPGAVAGRLSPRAIKSVSDYAQRSPVNYGRYLNMPLQAALSSGRNQQ